MGKGNYRASDEGLGVGVECLTIHYDGEVWELSSFAFYKYEQCYYKKLMSPLLVASVSSNQVREEMLDEDEMLQIS